MTTTPKYDPPKCRCGSPWETVLDHSALKEPLEIVGSKALMRRGPYTLTCYWHGHETTVDEFSVDYGLSPTYDTPNKTPHRKDSE